MPEADVASNAPKPSALRRLCAWTSHAGLALVVWAAHATVMAACATSAAPTQMGLDEVLRAAACHSPELTAAAAAERKARFVLDEAASALRPSVDVHVSGQTSVDRPQTLAGDSSSVSVPAIALSQTLYDSGASQARRRQREDEMLAQRSASVATLRDVLSDAITALIGYTTARDTSQALRESEESSRLSLSAVQAKFNAGSATQVDVLSAVSNLADAVRQRRSGEGDEARYAGQLANRLGLPLGRVAIDTDWIHSIAGLVSGRLDDRSAADVVEAVTLASPSVVERQLRLTAAEHQLDNAKAENGWTLKWSALTGPNRQWMSASRSSSWHSEVSLTATLPLFDGGARQARIGQALASSDSARADIDTQRLNALQDAWTKWSQWKQSRDALEASQAALESASALGQARRDQYAAGAGTLSDLLTALTQLSTQRKQLVSSRSNLITAQLALLLALGAFDSYLGLVTGSAASATP